MSTIGIVVVKSLLCGYTADHLSGTNRALVCACVPISESFLSEINCGVGSQCFSLSSRSCRAARRLVLVAADPMLLGVAK